MSKLTTEVAAATGQSETIVAAVLAAADAIVVENARDGESTRTHLGTFKAKTRQARTARNPKTGAVVAVPAKTVLTFKASSTVKL